jgi:hypothetical protein
MSNRKQAFAQPQSNPSTKFIEWKSNDKCFSYYDKEKQENVKIFLPFKFLVLDELHTIKGWNDATSSSIYSNEVKFISKEEMTVKPFKGNEIAKGLYKDIKDKIVAAGGHYTRSIYIMLEDGSLANIQLKGSATQQWGDFTQKTRSRLADEWVIVKDTKDGKKGAVKYSMPNFVFEKSLTDKECNMADECFDILEAYLKTYLVKQDVNDIEVVLNGEIANDFNETQEASEFDDELDF